jgi:hypothetical protein
MTTKYLHTLVYKIDGIQLGPGGGEIEIIADNAARFRAVVSTDPDDFCFEGDRWSALANLWLNALFGQPGLEISSERITEELEKIRESRKSQFGTGPYLIFVRDGEIEDFSSAELVKDFEDFLVYQGGPPRETLRQPSRPYVRAALGAMTIAMGDVHGIKTVSDTVVFFRSDGKPLYCYTVSATADASVIRAISEEKLDSVEEWYRVISRNPKFERVVRLLVASLQAEGDALRSFLYAWTALEILINKMFSQYEKRFFEELSEDHNLGAHRQYLESVREVMKRKYRLTDKFALIAAVLSPANADEDLSQFKQAKKKRDDLMHGQDVNEGTLPIPMIHELVRKYVRLHLSP